MAAEDRVRATPPPSLCPCVNVVGAGASAVTSSLSCQPHSSIPTHAQGGGSRTPQWRGLRPPTAVLATRPYWLSWQPNAGAPGTKENPHDPSSPSLDPAQPVPQILVTMISYKVLNENKILAHQRTLLRVLKVCSPNQDIRLTTSASPGNLLKHNPLPPKQTC